MWEYLDEFDIIGLTETWIEEETWRKIKNKLPSRFEWFYTVAVKENKKSRAKEGIVMAINKEIKNVTVKEINKNVREACTIYNKKKWKIITLYSQSIKETMETLKEEIKEEEEGYLMTISMQERETEENR